MTQLLEHCNMTSSVPTDTRAPLFHHPPPVQLRTMAVSYLFLLQKMTYKYPDLVSMPAYSTRPLTLTPKQISGQWKSTGVNPYSK